MVGNGENSIFQRLSSYFTSLVSGDGAHAENDGLLNNKQNTDTSHASAKRSSLWDAVVPLCSNFQAQLFGDSNSLGGREDHETNPHVAHPYKLMTGPILSQPSFIQDAEVCQGQIGNVELFPQIVSQVMKQAGDETHTGGDAMEHLTIGPISIHVSSLDGQVDNSLLNPHEMHRAMDKEVSYTSVQMPPGIPGIVQEPENDYQNLQKAQDKILVSCKCISHSMIHDYENLPKLKKQNDVCFSGEKHGMAWHNYVFSLLLVMIIGGTYLLVHAKSQLYGCDFDDVWVFDQSFYQDREAIKPFICEINSSSEKKLVDIGLDSGTKICGKSKWEIDKNEVLGNEGTTFERGRNGHISSNSQSDQL